MIQPLHDALPADRWSVDRAFEAIISGSDLRCASPAVGNGARRDVRRIASTLFCSASVDPAIVTFAKLRAAQHWGLTDEEVDVQVTVQLLNKAARLMRDQQILAADRNAGLPGAA
ncbi:MAG: hypothetical protein ABWZ98_15190 [Nakamurella sp.]